MKAGLYQPDEFKDNCCFGLIAQMQGEPSHTLLQTAIEALTCMTHRGGINADGKTGDGCGLLIQKPDQFLRAVAKEQFAVDLPKQYAGHGVFQPGLGESRGRSREHEPRDPGCRPATGWLAQSAN